MEKKLLNLHLYTNLNCNLHCNHCYNNSLYQNEHKEIQKENLINLIKAFYSSYDVDMHLEGGEIFLRPEIFNALASLDKKILSRITITSNGTIYNDTKEVRYVLNNIDTFRISVEGHTDELNKKLREIEVETVLGNAEKYQCLGAKVVLRTTLHKENLQILLKETVPAIASRGFKNLQIYELQAVGRGKKLDSLLITDTEFNCYLSSLIADKPKDINIKMMFNNRRVASVEERTNELTDAGYVITKLLPVRSLSISTEGNVSICPWDNGKQILFNINQDKDVCAVLEKYNLVHECEHCSKIKLEMRGYNVK